jgi:hypothetical protein
MNAMEIIEYEGLRSGRCLKVNGGPSGLPTRTVVLVPIPAYTVEAEGNKRPQYNNCLGVKQLMA